ncbi:MMPL family transporter [Rothia nasimurium]|uniref:MMPL family transporter n=1 Tax=Rothia nasimurium TaxID=85336 RepID=UPI001F00BEC1|nr:MMPL family transporter [Rothia nasimurium]
MANFLYKLGLLAARKAWAVVLVWVLLLAGIGGSYAAFKGTLTDQITIPGTEAQQVQEQLQDTFGLNANAATGSVILQTSDDQPFTQEQKDALAAALAVVDGVSGVESTMDPFAVVAQLADGRAQLDAGQAELDAQVAPARDGEAQLNEAQAKIDETRARFERGEAPQEAWDRFNEAQRTLDEQRNQLNEQRTQLEEQRTQLEDQFRQLEEQRAQLEGQEAPPEAFEELEASQAELEAAQAQFDTAQGQLNAAQAQLEDGQRQLDEQRAGLENFQPTEEMWAELEAAQAQVNEQRTALQDGLAQAAAGQATIDQNRALLDLSSGASMVSADETAAIVTVTFTENVGSVSEQTLADTRAAFAPLADRGLVLSFNQGMEVQTPHMNATAEAIGIVVAFIILVMMLGSLVAAGLPILMALVGVGAAALGTLALSGVVEMTSTTLALGTMLGLAVGIDYTLFILNRHRNNLASGMPLQHSIAMAVGTSGSAVAFAGITVMIALLALNIVGIPFLGVMGNAAAFSVFMAVAVALTLAPAILSLIGSRVMSKKRWAQVQERNAARAVASQAELDEAAAAARLREEKAGGWLALILKKPVLTIVASVLALGIVAYPVADMRLGLPGAESQRPDSAAYQAYQLITEEFGEGRNGTLVVAAELPEGTTAEQAVAAQVTIGQNLLGVENVEAAVPAMISEDSSTLLFQVVPAEGPNAQSTVDLVHQLRGTSVAVENGEADLAVTGMTAMAVDIAQNLYDVLPLYVAIVMGLSLVVLVLVFRSILVPVTATVGFLFSLLAALGATTAIYQWGWASNLFNITTPGPLLAFLPILAVGILFGLAMDYQVFLVSGMRESYAHGRGARPSVRIGFNHNSKVVVAAALIMAGVFMGFVFSGDPMIASIGFALAAGVLFDAFVVRMTLIPALMELLGEKAWWFPRVLDRLIPDLDVEGTGLEARYSVPGEDGLAPASAGQGQDGQGQDGQGQKVAPWTQSNPVVAPATPDISAPSAAEASSPAVSAPAASVPAASEVSEHAPQQVSPVAAPQTFAGVDEAAASAFDPALVQQRNRIQATEDDPKALVVSTDPATAPQQNPLRAVAVESTSALKQPKPKPKA